MSEICKCGIDRRDCEYHKPDLSVYLQASTDGGARWFDVVRFTGEVEFCATMPISTFLEALFEWEELP